MLPNRVALTLAVLAALALAVLADNPHLQGVFASLIIYIIHHWFKDENP